MLLRVVKLYTGPDPVFLKFWVHFEPLCSAECEMFHASCLSYCQDALLTSWGNVMVRNTRAFLSTEQNTIECDTKYIMYDTHSYLCHCFICLYCLSVLIEAHLSTHLILCSSVANTLYTHVSHSLCSLSFLLFVHFVFSAKCLIVSV